MKASELTKHTWAHSVQEDEYWKGELTREAALTEGAAQAREDGQDHFYIAPVVTVNLDDTVKIDAVAIIDNIVDAAMDVIPEDCDWLQAVPEAQVVELEAEVKKVVTAWLERHGLQPNWYDLGTNERITVES